MAGITLSMKQRALAEGGSLKTKYENRKLNEMGNSRLAKTF